MNRASSSVPKHPTFCAYVALAGVTNAGKSSVLNAMAQKKISITSPKPQTTRELVYGVINHQNYQAILVDTPGAFNSRSVTIKNFIQQQMMQGLYEGEIILLVLDGTNTKLSNIDFFFEFISKEQRPLLVAINKVDVVRNKDDLFILTDGIVKLAEKHKISLGEVIPVSALKEKNIDLLRDSLLKLLPPAPFVHSPDISHINSEEFIASELLREQVFRLLHKEIPFGVNVVCDLLENKESVKKLHTGNKKDKAEFKRVIKFIDLTLIVRKKGHKVIILGSNGAKIKEVVSKARLAMEEVFTTKVMLRVRVKVAKSGDSFKQSNIT